MVARGLIAPVRKIEFGLLGPLEVSTEGGPLSLGPPQQRALLALLLLNANEVVSSDRIVDELWGEEPPASVAKLVQVHVSALRKLLEPERDRREPNRMLITRPPGYLLEIEPDQLDLTRFEHLRVEARRALAEGDAPAARAKLGEALSLWRGRPLPDFAYAPFAQAAIARLEELRLTVLEERIEVDLELGGHSDVIGVLEGLVNEHPLRERFRAHLMLALYRSGRQADALEVYQATRRALTEELGIEPSRELRERQQAVLRQDAALDSPPISTAAPERSGGVFVGREHELAELVGALEAALAGRGRLVLLSGEPGIGKSRLADGLVGHARTLGARVIVGRCWEAGGAPPYWPWVQALRAYVRETDLDALQEQLGAGAGDIAQLLPELRELFELALPPAMDPEGARFRLFEAASSFLRSAAHARPIVLVLDDLHAADEPSLLLLRFVAREIADSRLLVACAFRDVDPTLRDPLTSTLAELVREPLASQIGLTGLSGADVGSYIELSTGVEPAPGLVEAIHAETDGNPLFVAEVVRLLDADGRIAEADAHQRIPPGVRTVIGRRVARLPERCRSLLAPASVLGREFGFDALAHLSELPHDDMLDALDDAMAERIVTDVPGSPSRLRFCHALIRDPLYDELPSARRLQLHHDAGEALEAVYSVDLEPHLAELAQHFIAAGPASADKAVDYARRAGHRAAGQLAYEEAARLYYMALPVLDRGVNRCEVLLALGDSQARRATPRRRSKPSGRRLTLPKAWG